MLDIITITKDDAEGLERTLSSTDELRGDPRVRQIVVDSSALGSARECAFLSERDRVYYQWSEAKGIARAFNEGLSQSTAEWVWFLNGGDSLHPTLNPAFLLEYLTRCRSDVVIGQIQPASAEEAIDHPPLWALWPPVRCWIPHPATIIRRSIFEKYGKFDVRLKITMDYDLWFRVLGSKAPADLVSIPFAIFDESGLSSSPASSKLIASESLAVLRHHWKTLAGQQLRYPLRTIRDALYWLRRT
jgi:glycosyltransferase involved in cell wall biosynthesis